MKAMNKPLRRRKREDDSDYADELTDHEVKFNTTQRLTKNSDLQVHHNDILNFSFHSSSFFKRKNRETN
jgi:hypothetical protein